MYEKMNLEKSEEDISRRNFLKGTVGLFGLLIAGKTEAAADLLRKAAESEDKKKGSLHVRFDIFFSAHHTAKDLEKLPEKIRAVDVYVPEFVGWGEKELKEFKTISSGMMKPEEYLKKMKYVPRVRPVKSSFWSWMLCMDRKNRLRLLTYRRTTRSGKCMKTHNANLRRRILSKSKLKLIKLAVKKLLK